MSMHLDRSLTTTSTRKRKIKITKAQQEELERGWRSRNIRLREMHLPKETFEQYLEWVYGKGKKTKTQAFYTSSGTKAVAIAHSEGKQVIPGATLGAGAANIPKSCNNWVTGPVSSKPTPTYTGTQVVGIAVMHKSCLQPVFSQEAAEDSAKMRR